MADILLGNDNVEFTILYIKGLRGKLENPPRDVNVFIDDFYPLVEANLQDSNNLPIKEQLTPLVFAFPVFFLTNLSDAQILEFINNPKGKAVFEMFKSLLPKPRETQSSEIITSVQYKLDLRVQAAIESTKF